MNLVFVFALTGCVFSAQGLLYGASWEACVFLALPYLYDLATTRLPKVREKSKY